MGEKGKMVGIIGLFDNPSDLLKAAAVFRDEGWRRWDCFTPYPVHRLDKAMGLRDSFMPTVTITAAFTGAILGKLMQWWMSAYDFPLIIGGTPLFALPAFIPVTFELFVLCAALSTFAAVLIACGLVRWHSPLHDAGVMEDVTSDHYAVYLDASDKRFSEESVRRALEGLKCTDVRVVYES